MNYRAWALLWVTNMGLKTISNKAKVYIHQLVKRARGLIRVEEHLKLNKIL